jgi:MFS family permease
MIFSPVAGVLADKVSTRQAPFLLGLSTLLAATVLLFLGRSIEVLLAARVLQGISGAVVWSVGMALCIETVGPDNLGKSIGTVWLLPATYLSQADFGLDVLLHFGRDYLGCRCIGGQRAYSDYRVTTKSHT